MNNRYKLIPKITLWILLALGILVSVMFYVGGSEGSLEVAGDFLDIPKYTNMMLVWNYILLGIVCLVNTKKSLRQLCVVVAFVVLVIVCWSLGSAEEVHIIGYEGTDNVGAMARLSDACLYMSYILLCGTLCAMIFGYCYTKLLK